MKKIDINNLDECVDSIQAAIAATSLIFNAVDFDYSEIGPLLREGKVGPTMSKARKIADKSKKMHHFAQLASLNTGGRSFEELARSGEAFLIALCMEVNVVKEDTPLDPSLEVYIPAKKNTL